MKISSYSNRIGGFVAINVGTIKDCYTDAKIKHDRNIAGFVFENTGNIRHAIVQKQAIGKENIGCFYVKNKGEICESGWLLPTKKKEKFSDKYIDPENIVAYDNLRDVAQMLNLGEAWVEIKDNDTRYELQDTLVTNEVGDAEIIEITSAKQLVEISAAIAGGDADAASANYKLTKNLKVKSKNWIPIGFSESNPFTGTFDGAGFKVSGVKIKSKGLAVAGFFGYIKNASVTNLMLDCVVDAKDGLLTGGMCADNENGTIKNCRVLAKMYADKTCGGFVGKNAGHIESCCFIGKVVRVIPIIFFLLPFIGLFLILLIIALILLGKRWGASPYIPEVIDPNQRPVIDHGTYDPPPAGSDRISSEMNQEAYFNVATQVGLIDFVNPKRGTKNLIVRIQISDAELLETIGKTGRKPEDQAKLDADPNYKPASTYQELFRSGLLEIGYALDAAKFSALPDGTTLPVGNYDMLVVVDAYDPETHEKSVMKTQLPIVIHMVESAEKSN